MMTAFNSSELLFYGGIALMCAVLLLSVAAGIALRIAHKRLRTRLEAEFGKRRK